jgi:hypothetical protein
MRAWSRGASLLVVVACAALGACVESRPSRTAASSSSSSDDGLSKGAADPAPGATASTPPPIAPMPAVSSGAMPPPTPKKPGCLDSTRGAKHTFVGKLEKHPDGSGAVRVRLPKKVCFSGGRFSAGDTDEVILDIDDARARPLLTKKVKVSGTSQDFAPLTQHVYVMRLEVTSLALTK